MPDTLLLAICEALTAPSAPLEPVVRGDDTHEPWARALDRDEAPVWQLPWLACLMGEEWRGPPSEQLRAQLTERPRFRRGTPASIAAAARATLTGAREVLVIPRVNDDPNLTTVVTRPAETPSPALTLQTMLRVTPAWVQLTHVVENAVIIDADTDITIDASGAGETIDS
ncbi:MAG TPA: hypothetical protein VN213_09380 [Solirubrobacteraceae bacterium]|nr:hypothetical protein [Solirubrobacteraceae bacterium]